MMNIDVIKFGGTSLKNAEVRKKAISIIAEHCQNHTVVVVVSAMGRYDDAYATDTLASLIHDYVTKKEKDRLLSIGEIISSIVLCDELLAAGFDATSLSILKAGIMTDACYGRASVEYVNTDELYKALKSHDIVVIPGFQGLSREKEITTLGRGGSDYSAVILARALHVKRVTIYSDVCGIYSGDPKIIEHVQLLDEISYQQAKEIAKYKSHVINEDAVHFAQKYHIDMILKSTFEPTKSTLIKENAKLQHCVCFAPGYAEIRFEKLIHLDDMNRTSFAICNDHYMFEQSELDKLKTPYALIDRYVMIHFVGFEKDLQSHLKALTNHPFIKAKNDLNTFFVLEKEAGAIINQWHDAIILEG